MRYDLDLFLALNEEYRSKPIVPRPRSLDGASLLDASRKRAADLDKKLGGLSGRRVLEVGCGRGHFCRILADDYGCEVAGVDIRDYPEWTERPDITLHKHDIATLRNDFLGKFDFIVSFAVWEHVEHPYAALKATRELLADDGKMYLYANLYRGPQASHRYRDIFFPWPHLLFSDDVIEDFYVSQGNGPNRPAWVNKLTHAQYLCYFEQLDFAVERTWVSQSPIDEEFYRRFEGVLGRYPRFDLERNFIYAIVTPSTPQEPEVLDSAQGVIPQHDRGPVVASLTRQLEAQTERADDLQRQVDIAIQQRNQKGRELRRLRSSRSWRMTKPLRKARQRRDGASPPGP